MIPNHYPKYTTSLLQMTYRDDVAHTLTPRTGGSQYSIQQAGPRVNSRDPTFFVIWIETQGDRVYAVAFAGYTNGRGQYLSSGTKEAKESPHSVL